MDALGARRWWGLSALTLAVLAVGLDGTILSVALPTLATDLHASTADLQWFVSAYTLVLAAALLPAGLLGDRYGRKKILLGALLLFGTGSLACAYAPSAGGFIAARVLLGLGAAAQQLGSASLLGMVRTAFVDGMDVMLWVCAAIAVAGIVLALVFLPGRAAAAAATQAEPAALEDDVVAQR